MLWATLHGRTSTESRSVGEMASWNTDTFLSVRWPSPCQPQITHEASSSLHTLTTNKNDVMVFTSALQYMSLLTAYHT